ncbi:chitinase [Photobacterium aphoticum]|uniref:Chitinase n=1 Tax=Photobacterium aphoticum TaxID=754436 RepID=A0A090QPI1_9GAMM|nr:chitinase [Photobacterium aphoticum]
MKKALTVAKAGSVIELGEGRYHSPQIIDKAKGTEDAPIVIKGNKAVFDGTVAIDSPWVVHQGNIYKTQVRTPVWQLFVDGKMVMSARWPNAQFHDGSVWDMKKTWRHQAPESRFGTLIDERPYKHIEVTANGNQYESLPAGINTQSLAESGIDATGAIAIMNIGSWLNWAQVVESHTPGSNTFTYSKDFSGSGTAMKNAADNMLGKGNFWEIKNTKYEEGHYYLEGKLALLDSENEWFFDKQTKTVYLWAPDGQDPNTLTVRGKTQTYGLTVRNSRHVVIEDVDFFATAFTVLNSQGITFDDIDARYYAYSQRMLGALTRPETIKFINNDKTLKTTNNTIKNSYLAYTDGPAFDMIKEAGNVIDNNLIHDIDYSNLGTGGEGSLNMALQSRDISFTNNTFHTAGNSEGVRVGAASKVTGNHVYNTSLLQHDGAAINVGVEQQAGTEIAYNWVHDSPKAGIRFDGVEGASKVGRDGLVHHNVVWNTNFSIIKGDEQATYNNVMFNSESADLVIFNKEEAGGINHQSETLNNLVGRLQGRKSGTPAQLVVPGTVMNNMTHQQGNVLAQLRGAHWGDFRPKPESSIIDAGTTDSRLSEITFIGNAPDIGAYEAGDATPWIPGHQGEKASNPVPFDHATQVGLSIDLMFKQHEHDQYKVYMGTTASAMQKVERIDGMYTVTGLQPQTPYYWRVDRVQDGKVTQGEIWTFSTR